jgi:hypothetical protein
MEDIVQASSMIARRAGETGMTRDDLAKAKDLLQKYGDERSRIFDQMVSLLSKPEGDGITDAWKELAEKGSALLEGLDSDVPKSPIGEGLTGLGAGDFFAGEQKVWAENSKGQLALVADVLVKVKAANMGLVQQCNDELKSIRDTNSDVQSALNESLEGIKAELLDVVNQLVSRGNDKTRTAWMKEGQAKEYIKKWNESVVQRTDQNRKSAEQKGILKKEILNKLEVLGAAREQLDEKWIEEMYRSSEEGAKALAESGETGEYRALDWARFGASCIEPLAGLRDAAKEQSKVVFEELLPEFQEESTSKFAALTDDPSKLEDWKSELQDKQEVVQEALSSEDEAIKNLAEGPYQDAARETFDEFRSIFADGMKLLFDKTKDAEDQLRV